MATDSKAPDDDSLRPKPPPPKVKPTSKGGRGLRVLSDPETRKKLMETIEECGWVGTAANSLGISRRAVQREMERDEEFRRDVKAATAKWQAKRLGWHARLAKGDARAAEWELERQDPEQFAHRDPESVTPEMLATAISGLVLKITRIVPAKFHEKIIEATAEVTRGLREKQPATEADKK